MKNQQDTSKGFINTDLKFDASYKSYFQWILNEFDAQQRTRYDLFSLKNTKYLAHHFNDFQNSIGKPLIRIRHSLVSDNYLAAEEIQNQNWQYFIECVIEVCKSREIGSTIQPAEEFLLTAVENVSLTQRVYDMVYKKRVYDMVYKMIGRYFYLTISKLSVDKQKESKEDFLSKNFWWKDSLNELDSWVACFLSTWEVSRVR